MGAFAARALAAREGSVFAADRDPAVGYFARFGPSGGADLEAVDVLDRVALKSLILRCGANTVVIAFGLPAAAAEDDPGRAWEVNVDGPQAVAEAATESGVRRLVFISSFAVYGPADVAKLTEALPLAPRSLYGKMKAVAEAGLSRFRERGLDVRILRPCGIYGPVRYAQGSRSARLIESLLLTALRGVALTLTAEEAASDEYLYVKDLAEAVALVATAGASEEPFIYNVGVGRKTTAEDLRRALLSVVPTAEISIETLPSPAPPAMPPLDATRMREVFGFAPRFTLESGFADYVAEAGLAS